MDLHFEDFHPGDRLESRGLEVSRDDILDFARKFDPQPFHIDEAAAAKSIYGGIIASGWHTVALCHRLLVEKLGQDSGSMGSPGSDEIRWKKPVRPGDTLSLAATVLEVTPSQSKPDRGTVKLGLELSNQSGDVVMTQIAIGIFRRRVH